MNVIAAKIVKKARKQHCCDYCNCKIEEGTLYHKDTCVFDGRIYTWKSHPECCEIGNFMYYNGIHNGDGVTSDWFEDFVCRRLFEECGYTREDVSKMSVYEAAKMAYNDLKENKLKVN